MKEILYIQGGRLSNHVGTHFWNAQQSYFTYSQNAEDPIVDHDISFREGLNSKGEPTFCPRLLLFDRKSNFGAISDPYVSSEDSADTTEPWDGAVVEYRQEAIPESKYHAQLKVAEGTNEPTENITPSSTRYWSDYALVDLHPRSLQRLPDVPEWEDVDGDWVRGGETFTRYEEDTDFIDNEFRMFIEECDNPQGIQIMNDTSTFGCFVHSFLTKFRDDFVKLPCLAFPALSSHTPGNIDADDPRAIKQALNDALSIQSLDELATITVPLQSPAGWVPGEWQDGLNLDRSNVYHTSAILSTHIESATLPLRLKKGSMDLSSLTSMLSWRNNTPLAHLSGILPHSNQVTVPFERRIYDLSALPAESLKFDSKCTFSRVDVSRGFGQKVITAYDDWAAQFRPPAHGVHAPAVSLPSSFPSLFTIPPEDHKLSVISGLQTTSRSSSIFAAYARLAKECLTRHTDVIARMGIEVDEVKELRDTMWTMEDNYKSDEYDDDADTQDAGLGEDEEF